MCGITGFRACEGSLVATEVDTAARDMLARLHHRGPDDSGVWLDHNAGIALGHRRLSIIDVSVAGHQPMISADGRYVVTMNGEIYNHITLREELSDYPYKGRSDTEVAVAAIQVHGMARALEKFVGMFAFAVWDRDLRRLYLARDRLGEKPVYYGSLDGDVVYASELKAIRQYPRWCGEIDRRALGLLLKHAYIPAPDTIFTAIKKLPPGTWISIGAGESVQDTRPQAFWTAAAVLHGREDAPRLSPAEAVDGLEQLLLGAVGDQMIADVPLGAFLSGGIDSSVVVALMQAQSMRKVKTFSIGFFEPEYNEADQAKRVAEHLGTEHTELYVTPSEARAVIPSIADIYDEPFADSSQIPTYLLCKLAREHVTVSLSGDGGDELFGGYTRYAVGRDLWRPVERTPRFVRHLGTELIRRIPPRQLDRAIAPFRFLLPQHLRFKQMGHKLHRLAAVWNDASQDAIYRRLICLWHEPGKVVLGYPGGDMLDALAGTLDGIEDFTERMMFTDMVTYLPDDILVKVDRASMSESLEVRVPFLDHRVVEYAWGLPIDIKVKGREGKWPLRQILHKYVPPELVDRPKMGFGVPIGHWLRNELRDWAEALLDEHRLRSEGFFDVAPIRERWDAHISGAADWHYLLWPVLVFQSWWENYRTNA